MKTEKRREQDKMARRVLAREKFIHRLSMPEHGGLITIEEAAKRLELTVDDVHLLSQQDRIILINNDSDTLVPAFQLDDNGKLLRLEGIITSLKNMSSIAKCSFFLNAVTLIDGQSKTPWEVLKDRDMDEYNEVLRHADNFMTM